MLLPPLPPAADALAAPPSVPLPAGGCGQPASVTPLFRRTKAWDDYAQPVAVLQLGQAVHSLHFVPGARPALPPRYLALGDAAGSLHLLSPHSGRLLAQHHTGGWPAMPPGASRQCI